MKSRIFQILLILLFLQVQLFTQPFNRPAGTSIKGYIHDSSTGKALEFANIVLFSQEDSIQVSGTVTNKDGFFELTRVRPGNYYIILSFIGFDNHHIDDISVTPGNSIDLGDLKLQLTSYSTDVVTVQGERAPISYELDKKVINVSEQISATSGTAVDVLENVPSVTVDIEGNVSLRGSSNFTVLIDGRPSVLDASDALQQIPASAIQNLEIITNPSAKYNPEGTSGIINVVMKKNENLGFSGTFELNGGLKDKYGTEALVDYKAQDFSLNLGANYNERNFSMEQIQNSNSVFQGTNTISNSNGSGSNGHNSYGFRGQLNYDFSDNDLFTLGGRYGYRDRSGGSTTRYEKIINNTIDNISTTNIYTSVSDRGRKGDYYSIFSSFKHKFSNNGHEITVDANYRYNDGDESTVSKLFDANQLITEGQITNENGPGQDFQIKSDYLLTFSEDSKLEAGIQSEIDLSDDFNELLEYNPATQQFEIQDKYSRKTQYKRNVHSIYTTFSESIDKLNFQIGLRTELTDRNINLIDTSASFSINRWDFFPGLHTSFKIDDANQLMLSYTRRIRRPRGWQLEPFQTWMNAYNIRQGNPALKPEYIDSYELGYQLLLGKSIISAEGYYRINNNRIEMDPVLVDNDIRLNSFANVGKDYALGTELMLNFDPVSIWNVNLIGNLYNYRIKAVMQDVPIDRSNFSWNLRFNNMFKIVQGTSVQVNGMYNSPTVSAQRENKGFFTMGLALKQAFFQNSLVATLQVRDIFGGRSFESITNTGEDYTYSKFTRESPMVFLNLKWIFNNYKSKRDFRPDDGGDMEGAGEDF